MATQRYHQKSNLCAVEVDLSQNTRKDYALIPSKAHILQVSLEILEPSDAGAKAKVLTHLGKELGECDISTSGVQILNHIGTTSEVTTISLEVSGSTKGKAMLRAFFFHPSTEAFEF